MASKLYNDLTDKDLMKRVKGKDHEAFSVLVYRHTSMFYAAAYRICADQNDAEDIVQEAFLKLWKNPDIWNEKRGAKFTTWFYRIVINQAIDFMRKKKARQFDKQVGDDADVLVDSSANQQTCMEVSDMQARLENAIQSLPSRQKIALNLCFYDGLSNKEAADILGVGVKALESLVMRAKSGLKAEFTRLGLLDDDNKMEGSRNG